jgi:hypothetical protein
MKKVVIGSSPGDNFNEVISLMIHKPNKKGTIKMNGIEQLIMMNNFDGAESIKTNKQICSVIGLCRNVISKSLIESKRIKTDNSRDIVTWPQVLCKEEFDLANCCTCFF